MSLQKRGEAAPLVDEDAPPALPTLHARFFESSHDGDLVPRKLAGSIHAPIADHTDYVAIYSRIASAQLTLPVISTLALGACFSFYNYYGTAYSHLDASTFIGRLAQGLFLCATSVAAVCSVYSRGLSDLGVTEASIPDLVKGALIDPSCGGNPIELTEENLTQLFKAAL